MWQIADMNQSPTIASQEAQSRGHVLATVAELIVDLGPTETSELLGLFAAHVSQTIARLHRGGDDNSLAALGRIAHTMKGTAGCYGATELRETSSRLAIACQTEDRNAANALLGRFEHQCQHTLMVYKALAIRCKTLA